MPLLDVGCKEFNCPFLLIGVSFLKHLDVTLHYGGQSVDVIHHGKIIGKEKTTTLWEDIKKACKFKTSDGCCNLLIQAGCAQPKEE